MPRKAAAPLSAVGDAIERCRACPRLVSHCAEVARGRRAAFATQTYWGRPVRGFGDPAAQLLVLGLAPAAHGANRTGRVFTGDESGRWLYRALHRAGLASAVESVSRDDGLTLRGAYVSVVVRCAPPGNAPTPAERDRCLPFLVDELGALPELRAILALGAFAWDGALRALAARGVALPRPRPRFAHGAGTTVGHVRLFGSYHVSQQNTFTGRLTEPMLDDVLGRAWAAARATRS